MLNGYVIGHRNEKGSIIEIFCRFFTNTLKNDNKTILYTFYTNVLHIYMGTLHFIVTNAWIVADLRTKALY